MNNADNHGIGK